MKTSIKIFLVSIITITVILAYIYIVILKIMSLDPQQNPPEIDKPISITAALSEFSISTVQGLSEISDLHSHFIENNVIAMTQNHDNPEILLVIYQDGIFRQWDLNNQIILSEFNFYTASKNATNFSEDGSFLLTPGEVSSAGSTGYNIWDAKNGEQLDCFGPQCTNNNPDNKWYPHHGLLLDAKSRWVIKFNGSVISFSGFTVNRSHILNLDSFDNDLNYTVSKITQDKFGDYTVYFLDQGFGIIKKTETLAGIDNTFFSKRKTLGEYRANEHITTIAMSFDDTNTWFARLTGTEVQIWDLRKGTSKPKIQLKVDSGNTLAFDRTGCILAIGNNKGILLYNLENLEQIKFIEVGEVNSIYFSRDNRLLLLSDTSGTIHIWGVQ